MSRPSTTDAELLRRGTATLIASWEAYASGATGAAVHRVAGVAAAVFPHGPERDVYNNALIERDLPAPRRAAAIDAMRAAYAEAGVERFAAWVHESDAPLRADLERRGFGLDEATRAMGMALDGVRLPRPDLELGPPAWADHVRLAGMPPGFLGGVDRAAFHVLVGRLGGEDVATGIAFDAEGDCGIYNVGTLERARRRGLATAITTGLLHDAVARGCRTASLQATAMAERLYAALGFRDLGVILEYVP